MPTLDPKRNFGLVRLKANYNMTAASTTIELEAGDGSYIPAPATEGAFNLTIWRTNVDVNGDADTSGFAHAADDPNREIIRVTAKSSDTLTITRGEESTTASAHNQTDARYLLVVGYTKKDRDDKEAKFTSLDADVAGFARSKFHVYMASQQTVSASSTETLEFNTTTFDTNSDFSATDFSFVAPRDMYLWLHAQATIDGATSPVYGNLTLQQTGGAIATARFPPANGIYDVSVAVSVPVQASADDTFRVRLTNSDADNHDVLAASSLTYFCGWEIQKI